MTRHTNKITGTKGTTDSVPPYYQIRCTPAERAAWQSVADADARNLAAWVRMTLNRAVAVAGRGRRRG